jgi:hypothetical protein
MVECQYVVSAEYHSEMICGIIEDLCNQTAAKPGVNTLRHQFKLYKGEFQGTVYADEKNFAGEYTFSSNP